MPKKLLIISEVSEDINLHDYDVVIGVYPDGRFWYIKANVGIRNELIGNLFYPGELDSHVQYFLKSFNKK